jgi:phospholipase A-2-activating protein
LSDDPYMAAQKFIDRHELNQMFLDEIAQFIIKNTANKTSTQHSVSCDPFTGGNAYIAGSSNLQSYKSSNQTDPFTGIIFL